MQMLYQKSEIWHMRMLAHKKVCHPERGLGAKDLCNSLGTA
jgi:hypothetical protein